MFVEIYAKQPRQFGLGLDYVIRRCRGHDWVPRGIDGDLQIVPWLECCLGRLCIWICHVTQIADIDHEITLKFHYPSFNGMRKRLCSYSHDFGHIIMAGMRNEWPWQIDRPMYSHVNAPLPICLTCRSKTELQHAHFQPELMRCLGHPTSPTLFKQSTCRQNCCSVIIFVCHDTQTHFLCL